MGGGYLEGCSVDYKVKIKCLYRSCHCPHPNVQPVLFWQSPRNALIEFKVYFLFVGDVSVRHDPGVRPRQGRQPGRRLNSLPSSSSRT